MSRTRTIRKSTGMYLIELIAAIAISGFLAVVMSASLAETIRVASKTENKLLSAAIGSEIIERVRNVPYSSLPSEGLHNVRVNLTNPTSDRGAIDTSPICVSATHIDSINLVWQTGGATTTPSYAYQGSATLLVKALDANTKCLTATVTPANASGASFVISTVVSKNGVCAAY